ncbi:putative serine hydrolase [Orchesella cincta]|uniref:Putative serine hydrolase n=1 Tax=Orchesella cincta TaxID=48709 RepID=A0A1D2ND55_ORCCI|nr:putative serine hydrolase [Orchesella cincta]
MLGCTKHVFNKSINSKSFERCIRFLASYTRKDVEIPVPITGGHIAAQLWQGKTNPGSPSYSPIVCLHGVQDNSCSFDPLIPLILKDNMTIISVDQPGHGFSSHTKGAGYDFLVDAVATISRVMRHFNWEKVSLMGHSFGAITSFVFAGTNPDMVDRYIAIENLHVIDRDLLKTAQRTYKVLFQVEDKLTNPNIKQPSYPYDVLLQRVVKARRGTVTEEGIKTLLKRGAAPDPTNPNLFQFTHDLKTTIPSQYGRYTYEQSLKIASNLKCPVCVIKGDPGEDYEPREKYLEMVGAVKKANSGKVVFHLVPGTHHLHLNEPECVAPLISEFLDKKF